MQRDVYVTARGSVPRPRRIAAAGSSILKSRPSSVDSAPAKTIGGTPAARAGTRRPRSEPSRQDLLRAQPTQSAVPTSSAEPKPKPKPKVRFPKPKLYQPRKSKRPSLSEQLALIGNSAESINSKLCSKFGLEQSSALLRTPAKSFIVGKLTAKHPSPVAFFRDRCTYSFFHPFQSKEIQMVMYYRDMQGVRVSAVSQTLSFRLDKVLQQFGRDYNPANPAHRISIGFNSAHDMSLLQGQVMKYVKR